MYDRISGSSTRASQADERSPSMNSDSFTATLADLALRRNPPPRDMSDKMGCCTSKPQALDPNNLSTPSPESTSLFQYRTADLPQANVGGICVGLAAEWLSNLHNSPRSRMTALLPGSDGHGSAAGWQQQYQDRRSEARSGEQDLLRPTLMQKPERCRQRACSHPTKRRCTRSTSLRASLACWAKSPPMDLSICSACVSEKGKDTQLRRRRWME